MPPPKTLFVDVLKILKTIRTLEADQVAEAKEQLAGLMHYGEPYIQRELETARWVPRDLCLLAGRFLTPSERKRHQEALRKMEREGLIAIDTRHVMLLPPGLAKLEAAKGRTECVSATKPAE